jgi:sigma-E factor negative regulatory protein RseA
MTEQIREQLSALLDGELPRDEMGLLLRRLERDPELRRTFGSYALIGETLRAPGDRLAGVTFAARVSAAIDAPAGSERRAASAPAPHGTGAGRLAVWRRPMVRTALAASAAAMAVLMFRPEPQSVAQVEQASAADYTMAASPTPAQTQRLASYMVAHSQYSTPMVRRNVLSSLLAADTGITRVSYDPSEAP